MRRALLILLAVLLGGTGLFAAYLAWDYDPDRVSPAVDAPTYESLFEASVRQRTKKSFAELAPDAQRKVLSDILQSREGEPVREMALVHLRDLTDRRGAMAILRRVMNGLSPTLYETGVASALAIDPTGGRAWLDSLYRQLAADPAAYTPLGGYRASTISLTEEGADIAMDFRERGRRGADYAFAKTSEVSLFFPERPSYLLSVPNADDILERFRGSRFVRALDGTPVQEDVWGLPLLKTIAGLRARLTDAMGFLSGYFTPEELFRDNLVIGKYDDDYLIVSFRDKNVAVAEGLVSIFESLGKDFGIRRWKVDGIAAAGVKGRTGRVLAYATPGDYFVVATDTALLSRALHTYATDRAGSIGIDPVFRKEFAAVDPTGTRQILFAWLDPTEMFEPTGSERPAARRLAILASALGATGAYAAPAPASLAPLPAGTIATMTLDRNDPVRLWRYIVDVRSLGKNPVDSLARLSKVDIGRQVMPYLGTRMRVSYGGVGYLRESYGYSNTAFDLLMDVPLSAPPPGFDTTMRRLFAGITSLVYTRDTIPALNAAVWIARDTSTSDSVLLARKLQPSFAVVGGSTLIVASTPELLRAAVTAAATPAAPAAPTGYFSGRVLVDTLAGNGAAYLKPMLLRTGRYAPDEIADRIDPLRRALGLYNRLEWSFGVENGLRTGTGRLVAR